MKLKGVQTNVEIQVPKTNKGKKLGATAGLAAGVAVNVHNAKPLLGYINRNLDKIQAKHPNIKGNYTDVFKAYLTPAKSENSWVSIIKSFLPQEGKKGIVFAQNNKGVLQKAAVMGGIIAAGAIVGTTIGAIADKIKHYKLEQKAKTLSTLNYIMNEKMANAKTISVDDLDKEL